MSDVVGDVPELKTIRSIRGWMSQVDHAMFRAVAALQADIHGDLLEIGAYEGKSAVVIGGMARPGETVHVCDPFETAASAHAGPADQYPDLRETTFLGNYSRFHSHAPVLHRCLSSALDFPNGTEFRFIHIDGSHAFEDVVADIELSKRLSTRGTVIAFDDYRKPDAPGVGAAIWSAVAECALLPLVMTGPKLYATWDDTPFPISNVERAVASVGCSARRVPMVGERQTLYVSPVLSKPQRVVLGLTPPAVMRRSDVLRGFLGHR